MPEYMLRINGERRQVTADPNTPLLWVLRDTLSMTGTKFGCGMAQCGACTVHVDEAPVRSCTFPVSAVGERRVTRARCTKSRRPAVMDRDRRRQRSGEASLRKRNTGLDCDGESGPATAAASAKRVVSGNTFNPATDAQSKSRRRVDRELDAASCEIRIWN